MYGQRNYPPPFQQQPNLPPPSSLQQATPGPLPPPILLNQPHAEMRRAPPSPAPPQYQSNVPLPQQRTPLYLRPSLQPCLPPPPAYSQPNGPNLHNCLFNNQIQEDLRVYLEGLAADVQSNV